MSSSSMSGIPVEIIAFYAFVATFTAGLLLLYLQITKRFCCAINKLDKNDTNSSKNESRTPLIGQTNESDSDDEETALVANESSRTKSKVVLSPAISESQQLLEHVCYNEDQSTKVRPATFDRPQIPFLERSFSEQSTFRENRKVQIPIRPKSTSVRTSDLVSLAEKGGKDHISSSSNSETSSSTSSEEEALTQFLLHQKAVERAARASAELQRLKMLKHSNSLESRKSRSLITSSGRPIQSSSELMHQRPMTMAQPVIHSSSRVLEPKLPMAYPRHLISGSLPSGSSEEGQSSSCEMTSRSLSRQTTLSSNKGGLHQPGSSGKASPDWTDDTGNISEPAAGPIREQPARSICGSAEEPGRVVRIKRQPSIKLGRIELRFAYDAPSKKLIVRIMKVCELAGPLVKDQNQVLVKLILLAKKKQKIKTRSRTFDPQEMDFSSESYIFKSIDPSDVLNCGLRIRIYSAAKFRRHHFIAETLLHFSKHKPNQQESKVNLILEPKLTRSDSRSDVSSMARSVSSHGSSGSVQNETSLFPASGIGKSSRTSCSRSDTCPELLLGLSYNGTTGSLSVTVIKGSGFKSNTMSREPDTHVKLSLVSSSGLELSRSKTSVRSSNPNPTFKETFVFQVPLFQLPEVTLMVSVFNKQKMKRIRKEMIGWFSLGMNSSGEEELSHWNDMKDNHGEQVCRWHVLLDTWVFV